MARTRCWISRGEFMEAVGIVNAEATLIRASVRFETKYRLVAERIESMARGIKADALATLTDEGVHIVTVKGFLKG